MEIMIISDMESKYVQIWLYTNIHTKRANIIPRSDTRMVYFWL